MQVEELMNKNVISVSPGDPASLAAKLLYRHNIGSVPVCTPDGKLRGIVTDRDIVLRCVAAENDPAVTPVKEIMSRAVMTVSATDDVNKASGLMAESRVRRLPVTREGSVVGMLSLGDLARSGACDTEASRALSEISSNIHRR